MSSSKAEFFDFLDTCKDSALSEVKNLNEDDRMDEANVIKAKANIYDIAKAVYAAAENDSTPETINTLFLERFSKITSSWGIALDKARQHNDNYKIMIEEAKFSAVSEIRAFFDKQF